MPSFAQNLEKTLHTAIQHAIDRTHEYATLEHLLLALVKNAEDRLNVEFDTRRAKVRVLLLVEDSPLYQSWFLPLIYKEVVCQTQAVLGEGLNEEHRSNVLY